MADYPDANYTIGIFKQTLGGGSFSGRILTELGGEYADYDECYEDSDGQSPFGSYHITGGSWTVLSDNTWKFDEIGFPTNYVDWYRTNGAPYGVSIPCTATAYQDMEITCGSNYWVYENNNVLQVTINSQSVKDARYPSLGSSDYITISY
jgi:hypothetical protein